MLCSVIYNTSGKMFKQTLKPDAFLPNYLGERKTKGANKNLKEQEVEMAAFAAKLKAMQSK